MVGETSLTLLRSMSPHLHRGRFTHFVARAMPRNPGGVALAVFKNLKASP
jgi:hypothetical protein